MKGLYFIIAVLGLFNILDGVDINSSPQYYKKDLGVLYYFSVIRKNKQPAEKIENLCQRNHINRNSECQKSRSNRIKALEYLKSCEKNLSWINYGYIIKTRQKNTKARINRGFKKLKYCMSERGYHISKIKFRFSFAIEQELLKLGYLDLYFLLSKYTF